MQVKLSIINKKIIRLNKKCIYIEVLSLIMSQISKNGGDLESMS